MNFAIKAIKNTLLVVTLTSAFSNVNAASSVSDASAANVDITPAFSNGTLLDSTITSISNPSYNDTVRTAFHHLGARSFIEIIRTNARSYSVGNWGFLDGFGLTRLSLTPILTTTTPNPEAYAMLLSGLVMMAFIARRRRHI